MPKISAPMAAPTADRRPVTAGQQAAADHRGDDADELVADVLAGLDGVEPEQGVHAR